jgi:hypothetical protein
MLLHVYIFDGGVAVIQKPGAVGECVEAGLLWRWLRRRGQKVCYFFDAFGEIQLRFLALAIAVAF